MPQMTSAQPASNQRAATRSITPNAAQSADVYGTPAFAASIASPTVNARPNHRNKQNNAAEQQTKATP